MTSSGTTGERAAGRSYIEKLGEIFGRVAVWSYDHRWIVAALCVTLLFASLWLASQARIDNSFESYFDPRDITYADYEQYREDFGSDEVSYILYEAPEDEYGPWNLEVMRKIARLTSALEEEVPFVYEVTSLANAERIVGVPDGIEIVEIGDDFPKTQEELLAVRDQFLANPLYVGGLVSADARHGGIFIEMDRSSTDPLEEIRLDPDAGDVLYNLYPQATFAAVEEILARPEYSGIRFFHTGDVPLNSAFNIITSEEGLTLNLIVSAVIAALLLFFFRSVVGVIGPLAVVQLSVITSVAFVALLGWKLDMSFGTVPALLTAIGVAHSVHILTEFRASFAELGDRREALRQTLSLVGAPCLLTSLTTAAGFLVMGSAPIKSIAHMGIYSSVGVIAAFGLSLTLLIVFLSFGRRTPRQARIVSAKGGRRFVAVLAAIARFNIRFRIRILVFFGLLFIGSAVGTSWLMVDSNWLEDLSYDVPLRSITEHVDEVMGGTGNIIYLFDAGEPDAIMEPAALRDIARLQQKANDESWLVVKTYSIVDIVKDLNRAFHGGDPAWYAIPETRELVAQYLLLYEMSGGEEVEEYISSDYSRASLEIRVRTDMTKQLRRLVDTLDAYLAQQPLEATTVATTGVGALWLKLLEYLVSSQIRGILLAFVTIGLMMCLIFRSFKTGLISMVPNLSPVVLTLGAMGWVGEPLDYNKVFIATVAIGIAVDDTIHLMSRFHHEFLRTHDYAVALRAAMLDVGRALFITSVALVLGFLVFVFSVMDSKASFGVLLAVTIVMALVADFLLMPALVLTFKPFGPEGEGRLVREPSDLPEAA